jgi:hypothetical protein
VVSPRACTALPGPPATWTSPLRPPGRTWTRLAAALHELHARIRTEAVPDGLPFSTSAEALAGQRMLNLQTTYGELDLTIRPAAFEGGYDELAPRALRRSVGNVRVRVAALADVIRSKETAGRRKDQEALPELYQLAGAPAQPPQNARPPTTTARGKPSSPDPAERIAAARQRAARRDRQGPPPGQ